MKIHLDYLEGKVEELENTNLKLEADKKSFNKKMLNQEEKYLKIRDDQDREINELKK